jgi:hypothetical protein
LSICQTRRLSPIKGGLVLRSHGGKCCMADYI